MDYVLSIVRYLKDGALVSLLIFFTTVVLSLPLGLVFAVFLDSSAKWVKKTLNAYTWLFRGTPLMMQLFFFMYGLPAIGITVDRMMVAVIAFALNYTAYFIEIFRAGIESIPSDQFEAASVEGASRGRTYIHVVLPQAVRKELPTITNELITLIKDTALVSVIAVGDLLRGVREIVSRDFTVTPFFVAAGFYLMVSFVIVQVLRKVEQAYDFGV